MRTTLTLDDDLARRLKELSRRQARPFKDVVNEALRRGLSTQEIAEPTGSYRVDTFRGGVDPLKLNQLVDELEAERAASLPAGGAR